jgi:predicted dehydrogenase
MSLSPALPAGNASRAVFSRRSFFKTLAAAGAGAVVAPSLLSARNQNSRLQIACVGVGGRGAGNVSEMHRETHGSEKYLAFCDVNSGTLAKQSAQFKVPHSYADYRELLDKHAKELDAIFIGTLDHTHGIIACDAMSRGIHCYCEKPLARTVWENRQMARWAASKKLCTQTGTQVRSWGRDASAHYYRGIEMVRAGVIGDIAEVHVWCDGTYVPKTEPTGSDPVPSWLNYDLWLGPTPAHPFNKAWLSFSKYGFWHSGCGMIAGMGPHTIDLAWTALNLAPPTEIEILAQPLPPSPLYNRDNLHVVFTHPRTAGGTGAGSAAAGKPIKLHWYDAKQRPAGIAKDLADLKHPAGVLFVGERGNIQVHYGYHKFFPAPKFAGANVPRIYPNTVGHHRQWLEAIKAGKPEQCECRFEYAAHYTEAITLAALLHRTGGTKLAWNSAALTTDNAAVNALLRPQFRDGWKFPEA